MNLKEIKLKNIGAINDADIKITEPFNIIVGLQKQGKTTILNSVIWCLSGGYPEDILSHGSDSGEITLLFDGGHTVSRKIWIAEKRETGEKYITDKLFCSASASSPATWLKERINPFQLDQDYFSKMKLVEQNRFLSGLFNIDTSEADSQISKLESKNKELRIEIKAFGVIDITPVEKPDLEKLTAEKAEITTAHSTKETEIRERLNKKYAENKAANDAKRKDFKAKKLAELNEIKAFNTQQDELSAHIERINECKTDILDICDRFDGLMELVDLSKLDEFILGMKKPEERKVISVNDEGEEYYEKSTIPVPDYITPEIPDDTELKNHIASLNTAEIDEKISNCKADQLRHESYLKNVERNKEKEAKESELKKNEAEVKRLKDEKIKNLAGIETGIAGLIFTEDGYQYNGTSPEMLSTSEKMQLNSELMKLFPSEIKIKLIDRGESIGWEGIEPYIEDAKENGLTTLMSFVSSRPADNLPENVGVFVVKSGQVS